MANTKMSHTGYRNQSLTAFLTGLPGATGTPAVVGYAMTESPEGLYVSANIAEPLVGEFFVRSVDADGEPAFLGYVTLADDTSTHQCYERGDASLTAAIVAAVEALSAEDVGAIALAVYRRLVGGSVALLDGPTSDSVLDVVHNRDFNYSIEAAVAADSKLVWSVRSCENDTTAKLEISSLVGLEALVGVTDPTDADGSVTRVSATQVDVFVRARSLAALPPGEYIAELRELTSGDATLSRHEVPLSVRRSASRAYVE